MARRWLAAALVLLACFGGAAGQNPAPTPGGGGGVLDILQLGQAALLFLKMAANLPESMQRDLLKSVGQAAVDQGQMYCNIFGGTGSCQTLALPPTSAYVTKCPNANVVVDCAYLTAANQNLANGFVWAAAHGYDPSAAIAADVSRENPTVQAPISCPACQNNLENQWCASAVPACGTFDATVVAALLPALSRIAAAQQAGTPAPVAVATELPALAARTALGLPCRRLCRAVVASCACNQPLTLGAVVDQLAANPTLPGLPPIPPELTGALIAPLRGMYVCDLYADETTPGYRGYCPDAPPNATCGTPWCNGNVPMFAQAQMVAQLGQAVASLVRGPALWTNDKLPHRKGKSPPGGGGGGGGDYDYFTPPPPPGGGAQGGDGGGGGGDPDDGPPPNSNTVAARVAIACVLGVVLFAIIGGAAYAFWARRNPARHVFLGPHASAAAARYQEMPSLT